MAMTHTYKSPQRRFFLRFPDALEGALNAKDHSLVDFSESACMRIAKKKTGLSDFGPLDFHEPLSILLKSCREDANLTFAGKMFLRTLVIKTLINRLLIEDDIKTCPRILRQPILKPLIIIGLPRTGTTLLHNLLSQDPDSRFLRCWEAMKPSPPPYPHTDDRDHRILKAKLLLGLKQYLSPEMSTVKPIGARSAEECIILLGHTFMSHRAFTIFFDNPQYLRWLKGQDMTPAYRYYYRMLQHLQWRYSKHHWVLKAPEHLINIEPVLSVFPDACLVQTHRDMTASIPSSSSMMAVFRGAYSKFVDLKSIGKATLEWMAQAVEQGMAVRRKHDEQRFCDISYDELINNPIGTVHKIYNHFGYPCSKEMDQSMQRWLDTHPRHKKGVHRYCPAQFGLDEAQIHQRFRNYYAMHKVHIESH